MRHARVILGDDYISTAVAIPLSKDSVQRHDHGKFTRQLQSIARVAVAKVKSDSALWLGIFHLKRHDNWITTPWSAVARRARVHHFIVGSRRVELLRLHATPERPATRDLAENVPFVQIGRAHV